MKLTIQQIKLKRIKPQQKKLCKFFDMKYNCYIEHFSWGRARKTKNKFIVRF